MICVSFHNPADLEDSQLLFAVIAARFQGKWVFSRHQDRSTWEIPGGHREPGEPIDVTARRELYEETGARDAEIRPVCTYSVTNDNKTTYGMLYFADVSVLGPLPASEICEISFHTVLPQLLTYPEIQPALFEHVQGWLNIQSGAGELWDIYDSKRRRTGRIHRRGAPLADGDYHLVVHVWVQNTDGSFLLTQRSPNKGFPYLWECTGGSALAGEDSLTAAIREVREETGLILIPENGHIIHRHSGRDYHRDIWLFRQAFDIDDVRLLEGETCGKMCLSADGIFRLAQERKLVPYNYIDILSGVSVFQAAPEDADTVAGLALLLWPDNSLPELVSDFNELFLSERAAVFLIVCNGEPAGFGQCQLRYDYVEGTQTSPVGYLEGIFVKPEYRRRGYARRLLSACEQWAKSMGCREFASDCELDNEDSLRFHLKTGFLEANRIICFTKELR